MPQQTQATGGAGASADTATTAATRAHTTATTMRCMIGLLVVTLQWPPLERVHKTVRAIYICCCCTCHFKAFIVVRCLAAAVAVTVPGTLMRLLVGEYGTDSVVSADCRVIG